MTKKIGQKPVYDIHRVGVGGVCIHQNKILLVKIGYGPSKDKWILPGGLVEFGEQLSEAVEREVLEETGVQTKTRGILSVRHMINQTNARGKKSDLYVTIRLQYIEGQPTPSNHEISDAKFVSLKQLENRPVGELIKHIIDNTASKPSINLSEYQPSPPVKNKVGVIKYELYV